MMACDQAVTQVEAVGLATSAGFLSASSQKGSLIQEVTYEYNLLVLIYTFKK